MKVEKITFKYGRKFNLGNFNSIVVVPELVHAAHIVFDGEY
jgi:hypothetical protein